MCVPSVGESRNPKPAHLLRFPRSDPPPPPPPPMDFSSSLVSRTKTAFHSAAAKAEKVLTDIKTDFKNDRGSFLKTPLFLFHFRRTILFYLFERTLLFCFCLCLSSNEEREGDSHKTLKKAADKEQFTKSKSKDKEEVCCLPYPDHSYVMSSYSLYFFHSMLIVLLFSSWDMHFLSLSLQRTLFYLDIDF